MSSLKKTNKTKLKKKIKNKELYFWKNPFNTIT